MYPLDLHNRVRKKQILHEENFKLNKEQNFVTGFQMEGVILKL